MRFAPFWPKRWMLGVEARLGRMEKAMASLADLHALVPQITQAVSDLRGRFDSLNAQIADLQARNAAGATIPDEDFEALKTELADLTGMGQPPAAPSG